MLALALIALAACSSATTSSSAASGCSSPTSLTVLAAASLTEAFSDAKADIESSCALSVRYSFAGSGTLVTQVEQGAPADVIATADASSMQKLVDEGIVDAPITFATNALQMLVAAGNPKGINGLADLARDDIVFVTEADTVPAGKYAAQALQRAGVRVNPKSKELDVKAAVSRVTSGEADATIVYVTDVRAAGAKGQGVEIPKDQNIVATYPIAIVQASTHRDAAAGFVEAIVHGRGHDALLSRGFLAAP